jgi:CheY-like chemotaxis protein
MEMPDILVIDDDPAMLDCIRMSLITMNTYQV